MTVASKKILVVGPSWVGDMVMAQSLFKVLKQQDADCRIDVLAPGWTEPLLARMPEVHQGIDMPVGHGELQLGLRLQLGKSLRGEQYDQAIVLPNSLKSALVPFWANIPLRTGFTGEARVILLNDRRELDQQKLPMTVQRFVSLALPHDAALPDPLPVPELIANVEEREKTLAAMGLVVGDKPILALCPGAEFGEAKRWPEQHYADIASSWYARGWQVWLFGSENDRNVCDMIEDLTNADCLNIAGETSLQQAIDLMSLASMVLSNDSGLMHIAAALGLPTLAIYGSSDPGFTPPLSDRAEVIRLGLDCSPCFERICPMGHLDCLTKLTPDRVLEAMDSLQTG